MASIFTVKDKHSWVHFLEILFSVLFFFLSYHHEDHVGHSKFCIMTFKSIFPWLQKNCMLITEKLLLDGLLTVLI